MLLVLLLLCGVFLHDSVGVSVVGAVAYCVACCSFDSLVSSQVAAVKARHESQDRRQHFSRGRKVNQQIKKNTPAPSMNTINSTYQLDTWYLTPRYI